MSIEFSEVFSKLRKEAGISQRQAAAELGISQALLSHYENGIREPKLDFIIKACNYYNVSADYILGRTSVRNNPMDNYTLTEPDIARLMDSLATTLDIMGKAGLGNETVWYFQVIIYKLFGYIDRISAVEQTICDGYVKLAEAAIAGLSELPDDLKHCDEKQLGKLLSDVREHISEYKRRTNQ